MCHFYIHFNTTIRVGFADISKSSSGFDHVFLRYIVHVCEYVCEGGCDKQSDSGRFAKGQEDLPLLSTPCAKVWQTQHQNNPHLHSRKHNIRDYTVTWQKWFSGLLHTSTWYFHLPGHPGICEVGKRAVQITATAKGLRLCWFQFKSQCF